MPRPALCRANRSSASLPGCARAATRYPEAAALNDLAETVLVAGAVTLIGNRLLDGEAERLAGLEDELVELALAPCLGVEGAGELARSSPL